MGRVVIACYRPKPGHADALRALVVRHHATLHGLGLVTDRAPIAMQAADGTFVEVFEWRSTEAIEQAHHDPTVLAMWEEYALVCDYVPVAAVDEATRPFSEFTPVDVARS